jgi:hypothetical protein
MMQNLPFVQHAGFAACGAWTRLSLIAGHSNDNLVAGDVILFFDTRASVNSWGNGYYRSVPLGILENSGFGNLQVCGRASAVVSVPAGLA